MSGLIDATATVTMAGVTYSPIGGSLTLDETTTYATATWDLPFDEALWALDPNVHTPPRVTVDLVGQKADPAGWASLGAVHANLSLRSIVADRDADTMTFTASSDEALMADFSPITELTPGLSLATSIRGIVNAVLYIATGLAGALEPTPGNDAPVVSVEADNLIHNPSIEENADGWGYWLAGASGSGTRSNAGGAFYGSWFYRVAFTSNASSAQAGANYRCTGVRENVVYTASAWVRPNFTQNMRVGVEWFNAAGTAIGAPSYGPNINCVGGQWTRVYHENPLAPAGATQATVTIYGGSTGATWLAGTALDVDAAQFGPLLSNPLTWQPGTSAWDYLLPLTASVGLRLFCDEQRKWRLVPPTYALAGTIPVTAAELAGAQQSIDRGDGSWAEGVVVKYTWPGAGGDMTSWRDVAGVAGRVQVLEFATAFPGPGAAAARLARLQAQHRSVGITAEVTYLPRPGMNVQVTLPDETPVTRRVQSVSYPFDEVLMTMTTREQIL